MAKPKAKKAQQSPRSRTPKKGRLTPAQRAFLAAYAQTACITYAAKAAQVGRRTHYDWLDKPEYAAAFADAEEEAIEALELEARRRALEGVEEPVGWHQGEAGGTVRRYSDALTIFLLKGARPEKYRERSDVNMNATVATANLTEEQLAERERRLGLPSGPIDASDLEGGG